MATLLLLLVALCGAMQVAAQSWTNVTDDLKDAITDQGNAVVNGSASDKLKLGPSATAVLSICAGVAVCFCGYRMLRPTMFISGFLVGGFLASSAIEYLFKNESWVDTAWWISLFVGGLLVGALVVAMYSIGIFAVGAAGGVLLATMLNTSVGYKLFPENPNTGLLIFAIVLGLLGGILALKIERPVIVVATSLAGAVLAVSGVGYFAKNFPDITDLKQFATKNEDGDWVYAMPSEWWGYLGGMLGLFVLGMLVQFKKTGSASHSRRNSAAKFEAKAAGYSHAPRSDPFRPSSSTHHKARRESQKMATVRTTAPRHEPDAKGKKKRKRSTKGESRRAQPPSSPTLPLGMFASSSRDFADDVVRRKLDVHDKWQLCTQKMRRELDKVEQLADAAVVQVQDEATALRHMRDEVTTQAKTTVQFVETFQTDVAAAQKTSVVLENELQALKKKLRTLNQRVQQQGTQSIDEDFLMTQLTELQERYETELVKHKDKCAASLENKQHAIDVLKKQLHHAHDEYRQETEAAARALSALEEELEALKHRVHELDRDHRQTTMEKSGRWQLALDDLNHRLGGLDRRLDDVIMQQERQDKETHVLPTHSHNYHAPPFSPPPPVPPVHDPTVHEKLHQLNGDVRRIADDLHRFTMRVDGRHDDLHQEFMRQLHDLGSELFKALDYDSRQHIVENKRVRDAMYDLDSHVRDLRDGMARMEDNIRRMVLERQQQQRSSSPPMRRAPMEYPVRSRRPDTSWHDEPFVYVPPAARRPFREDLQQVSRGRSRSRSSPRTRFQRSPTTGGRSSPPPSYYRPDDRGPLPSSTLNAAQQPERGSMFNVLPESQALSVSSSSQNEEPMSEPSESARVSEPGELNTSGSEQQRSSFRRTRRPKRPYEVIVIEDDEESAEEDVSHVSPNRAPPDIVEEDDDPNRVAVVMARIETVSDEGEEGVVNDRTQRPDALTKMADVRYGALLYFCFGGAPSLGGEWVCYFARLSPTDSMDAARVASFLDRYPALRSFPASLTQFMIQATVVDVPAAGGSSGSNVNEAVAVDNVDAALVATEFGNVVNAIRQAWALMLVVDLQKSLPVENGGDSAQNKWEIALNPVLGAAIAAVMPAAMEQHLTTHDVPDAWLHRQANALWWLLRQQHSSVKLPEFAGDMVASPGVYLFLLLFDVVHVNRLSPQSATFRLTSWGRSLVTQLWDHVLSKIPYLFFADCAWLEQQTDGGKLPPLVAFCHMVSALVAWNSIMDKAVEASPGFYAETVRLLVTMLHVNGVPVRGGNCSQDNDGASWSRVHASEQADIELVGVNTKLVSLFQLDGFFEVVSAIRAAADPTMSGSL